VADRLELPPEAVAYFVGLARTWVREQRELHRPFAQPLPGPAKTMLAPFFPAPVLDKAHWRRVPAIQNPPFLADAAALGIALDFSRMEGITFDDTFLVTDAAAQGDAVDALFFHELVHVVQYNILGVDEFITQWVEGYVNSADYYTIPLELVAYAMQMKWMLWPGTVFPVEVSVRRTVGLRRV